MRRVLFSTANVDDGGASLWTGDASACRHEGFIIVRTFATRMGALFSTANVDERWASLWTGDASARQREVFIIVRTFASRLDAMFSTAFGETLVASLWKTRDRRCVARTCMTLRKICAARFSSCAVVRAIAARAVPVAVGRS
ncbi:hypothetical protein [Dyella sp. AtDHG13]|uniref:hypothetical protein n=1 Tax=Dyella sp. AtDHG13 TaxID=1938897 RepID=UPI0011B58629|nr:hypothetical protein [Dyella sp. AtDHG13]